MKKGTYLLLLWAAAACCIPNFVSAQCTNLPVQSLVYNGNFNLGNTGFVSGYNNCQASNCLYPEGYYAIGKNANFYHGNFAGFDHTNGAGNYMIVNGTGVLNTIVWQQTITVKPGTNYNFSAWVRCVNPANPAALQFSINGLAVGAIFNAPLNGWQQFFVTWNSAFGTSAVITILNQNTTLNGNDFGLDDISFIEICPTPQPNLGNDQSLCGRASILLNAGVTPTSTMSVTWSDGTTGIGLGAPYSHAVSTVGNHWVCVQDGSCYKKDTVRIIADFDLELGPDVILCTPAIINLFSSYVNGTTSYKWYRNGVLFTDSIAANFIATTAGTYTLEVTDASCGLTKSDVVTVNSTAGIPNNGTFCPPTATFTVTPNPSGEYKWYDAPVAGTVKGKGSSITVNTNVTTTLYAEDTAAFRYSVGPSAKFPEGFAQVGNNQIYHIKFDAVTSFTLESVIVFGKVYNPYEAFTIGVTLRDAAGTFIKSQTVNVVGPPIVPVNHDWPFTITLNMLIPQGTDLRLTSEGTVGDLFWASSPFGSTLNNVDWNSYKVPGIVTLKGMDAGFNYCLGRCYPYFYNWVIKKGVGCARVPVTMVKDCPLPLDWLSFTAEGKGTTVQLNWETTNEHNTSTFVIERSSDGTTFTAIGTVLAKGSELYNTYHFTDAAPVSSTGYYRIRQVDLDGSFNHSNVQQVKRENQTVLFPVPASEILNIAFRQEKSGEAIITDMTGRTVSRINFPNSKDLSISVNGLPVGVYLIEIKDQYNSEVLKWTKE